MGLMAYDPARLAALRHALTTALTELDGVRCHDALAAPAMNEVRSTRSILRDSWLPAIAGILDCTALVDGRRPRLDLDDLRQALPRLMALEHGWTVAKDALGDDTTVVTAHEATALAVLLQQGELDTLLDTEQERQWLLIQLTLIADDPELAAAFHRSFTRWADFVDELAIHHLDAQRLLGLQPDDRDQWGRLATIESIVAVGAAVYQHPPAPLRGDPLPALMDSMSTFGAALFLRGLDLPPEEMALLAHSILVRDREIVSELLGNEYWAVLSNASDIVMMELAAQPLAAAALLRTTVDEPDLLFGGRNRSLAQNVMMIGTDPHHQPVADAGRIIDSITTWVFADPYQGDGIVDNESITTREFLGSLVAPWLLQLSPLNDEWAGIENRSALLAEIIKDDRAMQAVVDGRAAAIAGMEHTLTERGDVEFNMNEFAALVGMLGQVFTDERIRDEEHRLQAWDNMTALLQLPLKFVKPLKYPATAIVKGGRRAVDAIEWFGAPDPNKVADDATYQQEWLVTSVGASVVHITVLTMIEEGRLPPNATPPPKPDPDATHPQTSYQCEYDAWLDGIDEDARAEIELAKAPFLSAYDAGRTAALRGGATTPTCG